VASPGLVSPGTATDGVTPIFSRKKTGVLFSHHRVLSAISSAVSLRKNDDFFGHNCRFY